MRRISRAIVAACSLASADALALEPESGEAALLEQLRAASGGRAAAPPSAPQILNPSGGASVSGPVWSFTVDRSGFHLIAEAAAVAHGLDADFFKRLIRQESGFDPAAVSRAGAQGIAQFMPGTAALVGLDDPFDPGKALPKSAEFLSGLNARLGNLGLAAAAYNAGEMRVRAWLAGRGALPAETRSYVMAITGRPAESWAPAGVTPGPGYPEGEPRSVPTFSRLQSAEWRLGASLLSSQAQLVGLLETAGRRPVGRGAGNRAAPKPALRGERALCESMRATGCIVAAVY